MVMIRLLKTEKIAADVHTLNEKAKEQGVEPKILIYPESREQLALENNLGGVSLVVKNRKYRKNSMQIRRIPLSKQQVGYLVFMGESKSLNLLCKGVQITKKTPVTISIIRL